LLVSDSWRDVTFNAGSLSIVIRGGKGLSGLVENKIMVSLYFIVLKTGADGRRRPASRVVFPDAMYAGEFRRLCVQLKFS